LAASSGFSGWRQPPLRAVFYKFILLQKTENGRIIFPFGAVHVDFMLKAA
jgi:hypothetical protein